MQKDIDSISRWCQTNGIMANTDKTKVMLFGSSTSLKLVPEFKVKFGVTPLQTVSSYKYLGVTLDRQLNYDLHINKTFASASSKLKQFQHMRSFINVKAALLVFKSMLLPLLEYGDVFLSACTMKNRKKLQVIQNKGLRCALNKGLEASTDELHSEAKLLKLQYRREQHVLKCMFGKSGCEGNLKVKGTSGIVTRSQTKKLMKIRRPITEKFTKKPGLQRAKKMECTVRGLSAFGG